MIVLLKLINLMLVKLKKCKNIVRHSTSIAIAVIISSVILQQSLSAQSFANSFSGSNSAWTRNDIFQNKVFIENLGQFDGKDNLPSSAISYGIINSGQQIYFSSKGLTYRYDIREYPKELLAEIEKEQQERKKEKPGEFERELEEKAKTTVYAVSMEWLNANPEAKIQAEDIVPEYYTYGDGKEFYKASAYKKLMYKDLYPNIDVEYVFHEKEGIKYSLILHPGADPSKIQMKYSGADMVYKDAAGNIHIVTAIGDIIDHAPFTFYAPKSISELNRSVIPSAFNVRDNIVSFNLKSYNGDKYIVIDPWTVGVTMPASNKALEMERDAAGNIYLLGGTNGNTGTIPMVMRKYSSVGTFLWQYTPNMTAAMCGGRFTGEYGNDLKIDKANDIYIVAGGGCGYMYKLNSAGTVLWTTGNLTVEPYRLGMDCGGNSLYVISGQSSWQNANGIYSTSTGILSITTPPLFTSVGTDDLRDFVRAPNGNYYGMTSAQSGVGRLLGFSPTFANLWAINHGYPIVYWSAGYSGHWAGQPLSIHTIAVSKNFIYTTSGAVLNKRNLATGAIIGPTVTIPGGVVATNANGNSGIILDTCNNVYVSSQNGVYKYDANLNFIASAPTAAAVYDICLGMNNEILACGNGFLASLSLSACIPDTLNVTAVATPTGNCNNGNIGTATATVTGGEPSYSYYWIPGGQTTSSVSGLAAGTYSIIVTDEDCNIDTAKVIVTSAGALAASVNKTNLQCYGASNASATVSASGGTAPYTYSWSTGGTTATATGLSATTYSVTVTDANGCKVIMPVNISQPSPIPLGITATATTCNNPNGSAAVSATGSSGPYTYSWSSGSSGTAANGLSAGTYTVTVRDAGGCSQTATASIAPSTSPADPSFTQSPGGTVCIGTLVNFTHTGSAGTHNWVISPITPANVSGTTTNFSYTFLSTGTYTVNHTTTNGGCSNSKTSTVTVINCSAGPTVTTTGSSVCPGSCTTVTSSGSGGSTPYTYSWSNSATTQNINPCPVSTTTYTVTIRDNGGNTSTSTAVVTVNPAVSVTTTATNITCNGSIDGAVVANPGTGSSPYTYSWSAPVGQTTQTATGLSAGNYTVTVTDSKGCTGTSVVTINSPPVISGQFTKGTANCIGCGCKEWVMITGLGGTSPYSYSWSTSGGYNQRYLNQLCPGAYSINITDKNGCSVNVNLTAP